MLVSTLTHAPGARLVQLALPYMQVRSLSGCCHHSIHPSLGGDWNWALDFCVPVPWSTLVASQQVIPAPQTRAPKSPPNLA